MWYRALTCLLDLSQGDVYATSRFNTLEGHSGLSYLDKLISEDDSRYNLPANGCLNARGC